MRAVCLCCECAIPMYVSCNAGNTQAGASARDACTVRKVVLCKLAQAHVRVQYIRFSYLYTAHKVMLRCTCAI